MLLTVGLGLLAVVYLVYELIRWATIYLIDAERGTFGRTTTTRERL
jgi:hypothetical protein